MSYKIVIDSCGELLDEWKKDPRFESVPLTLYVGKECIIDDETFNQRAFLDKVAACPECPRSACPSPDQYRQAFECDADHVYGVTLSAELSGSYNSAEVGKSMVLEEHPEKKIHVFNSRSASIGQTLIGMKIQECENNGLTFEETVQKVEQYISEQHTFFVLENLDFLRKNGRLSLVKALVANALKIKPVMGSTDEGAIRQVDQARGINKALIKMARYVAEATIDSEHKTLAISHCNAPAKAMLLRDALLEMRKFANVIVVDTAGVSSLYASEGGVIVVS